jgi:hypothetical protein
MVLLSTPGYERKAGLQTLSHMVVLCKTGEELGQICNRYQSRYALL